MIEKIELRNFKCFETLSLTCSLLTLLCGMNGTGKSSVLQALLVLRQSFAAGELQEGRLVLNGELADLGAGNDVLFEEAETDAVETELHRDDAPTPCRFSFDCLRGADELQARSAVPADGQGPETLAWWGEVPPLGGNLFHVDAERMGQRRVLDSPETSNRSGHPGALNHLHARQEETLPSFDPRCPEIEDAGGCVTVRFRPESRACVLSMTMSDPGLGSHQGMMTCTEALVARGTATRGTLMSSVTNRTPWKVDNASK